VPGVKPVHAVKGIIICHLLLNSHSRSGRFPPEVLNFACFLLMAYAALTGVDFEDEMEEHKWMERAAKVAIFQDEEQEKLSARAVSKQMHVQEWYL
jgi:hypothetical protein